MTTVGRGKIIFCPLGFLFCHTRQQHKTMTTGSDSDGISLFAINLKHHLTSVSVKLLPIPRGAFLCEKLEMSHYKDAIYAEGTQSE